MNTHDAAIFLGAMIDGEGHIVCPEPEAKARTRSIVVSNTEPEIVDQVVSTMEIVGAKPKVYKRNRQGKKPIYSISVSDQLSIRAIDKAIHLFSPTKREKLQKVIESYEGITVRTRKSHSHL